MTEGHGTSRPTVSATELVDQLRRLAGLHADGAITAEEFALAKERLLGSSTGAAGSFGPVGPGSPAGAALSLDAAISPRRVTATPAASAGSTAPTSGGSFGSPLGSNSGPRLTVPTALVGGGGLLTLLAFVAMPLARLPFFGSLTAWELAGYSGKESSLALLWLVLLATLVVVTVGAVMPFAQLQSGARRRAAGTTVLCAASAAVVLYLVLFGVVQSQLSSSGIGRSGVSAGDLIGAGFWVGLLGMVTAGVGAVLDGRPASTGPESAVGP